MKYTIAETRKYIRGRTRLTVLHSRKEIEYLEAFAKDMGLETLSGAWRRVLYDHALLRGVKLPFPREAGDEPTDS